MQFSKMGAEYLNTHSFNMTVCCPAAAYVYVCVYWDIGIKHVFYNAVFTPSDRKAMQSHLPLQSFSSLKIFMQEFGVEGVS